MISRVGAIGILCLILLMNSVSIPAGALEIKKVIMEIDCKSQWDIDNLLPLLDELENFNYRAIVFITPELAEQNEEIVKEVIKRGHRIGVLGTLDLSKMSLDEQIVYLSKAFYIIQNITKTPEDIIDFKPYNYKFNKYTFEALKRIHARSITGIFEYNESYCKCWYARSLGKITFLYPIEMDLIAVPISEYNHKLLDSSNKNVFEDAKLKLEQENLIVLSLEPSHTSLTDLKEFLEYVKSINGKIDGLPNPEAWIVNLRVTAPSEARVGEEITLTISYTSTKFCPYYRFHIYGKYNGEKDWKLWDKSEHCYFVYEGDHTFTHKITIPEPPEGEEEYIVRVVGRASFRGCDADWPTADNFGAMAETKIRVIKPKLRLLFVPVNWAGERDFDGVVEDHVEYFLREIPLNNCRERVIIDKANPVNFQWPSSPGRILALIEENLRRQGINIEKYDKIIGLTETTPSQYCNQRGCIAGISNGPNSRTVWVTTNSCPNRGQCWEDNVTAHELGHTFGLSDEYCSMDIENGSTDCRCNNRGWTLGSIDGIPFCYVPPPPAPPIPICTCNYWPCRPDINYLLDPEESCFTNCNSTDGCGGYFVCCRGNPVEGGGRCIMSYMNAPRPRHFCELCRAHLSSIPQLRCEDNPDGTPKFGKVINVGLLIYRNDTVRKQYLEVTKGVQTSEYILRNLAGNYTLQLTSNGKILWNMSFNPMFYYYGLVIEGYDYSDIVFNESYISLAIPFPRANSSIYLELYHDEDLIFSEMIPVGTIRGKVTNNLGEPVKNALIQISGPTSDSVYTDENGTYVFIGLEPGNYEVEVYPNPYNNLMNAKAIVNVSAGETVIVNFTLQPAGSIAGKVMNISKEPLENIHFHLGGYEPPLYASNETGDFVIPYLAAGDYRIYMVEGHGAWYLDNTYSNYGDSMPLTVTLGNTTWIKVVKIEGTDYETTTTSTNTGDATVVVESGYLAGSLRAVNVSDLPNPPAEFPHGLFAFNITGLSPGQKVNVTLVLPSNLPTTAQYWKYGPNGSIDNPQPERWYQIPMGSNDGDNIITITLQDGGIGDDDGVANGVIVDQGGPGIPTAVARVPTLTPIGITALAGLLLIIGISRIKKRK